MRKQYNPRTGLRDSNEEVYEGSDYKILYERERARNSLFAVGFALVAVVGIVVIMAIVIIKG
jgi:hypothetical protein